METEYIVNYDIFNDAGQVYKWGNSSISITGDVSANDLADRIREFAAEDVGCLPRQVRIVGIFKL